MHLRIDTFKLWCVCILQIEIECGKTKKLQCAQCKMMRVTVTGSVQLHQEARAK